MRGCVRLSQYASYLYVPLAFMVTGFSNLSLRKVDRTRRKQLGLVTGGAFVLIVYVPVGVLAYGLMASRIMLGLPKGVFVSLVLYGTGDKVVVGGYVLSGAATAILALIGLTPFRSPSSWVAVLSSAVSFRAEGDRSIFP